MDKSIVKNDITNPNGDVYSGEINSENKKNGF